MRTSLTDAMRRVWAPDSMPDRKTALKHFRARYLCEQDCAGGNWWIHLDRPRVAPTRSIDDMLTLARQASG